MCGIAGYWTRGKVDPELLRQMGSALVHRGPDDSGEWIEGSAGIGFAHRRLSIVDLSPSGHQPMTSADGRWTLSFNGEIYNHRSIRDDLSPAGGWRGNSDTEVLLAAIAAWGLERALQRSVGMFALSVWDSHERQLHLARDRFGEKPLYFGKCGGDFVFASELKAITPHPGFDPSIDRAAVAAFAALGVVPAPLSIYRGIAKLEPATILTLGSPEGEPSLRHFWSYRDVVVAGNENPFSREEEALEALELALREALAGQSVADVPVGAFLSGGIDSSAIVALYQAVSGERVRTYSIGFEEAEFDESGDAKRIAEHLGTLHHQHRVGVAEAQAVIPLLPGIYDEPFADSSQIPTYLVSKFARGDVTVAISGDGGDELFAGYNRHRLAPALWSRIGQLPRPIRGAGLGMLSHMPARMWNLLSKAAGERRSDFGGRIAKGLRVGSTASSIDDVYAGLLDEWHGEPSPVLGTGRYAPMKCDLPTQIDDVTKITFADATGYLPDDILTKVDRAAMAVSLETRIPFLDHRVAAVAARIPAAMKVSGGKGKQILRKLLDRHVPRNLMDRPKAGFAVPVGDWIRGPLRDWAEELLSKRQLEDEGYFNAAQVRRRWERHLAGQDSTAAIWSVLMFQAWLDSRKRERAS